MLCRFAVCPTRISPESTMATIDGVVRPPSEFSMTFALLPSITATHELVVPRSIPIALAIGALHLCRMLRRAHHAHDAQPQIQLLPIFAQTARVIHDAIARRGGTTSLAPTSQHGCARSIHAA